jgi:hypothetical protein
MMESAACTAFNEGKLATGLLTFAAGSIAAAATGRRSPLSVGANLAKSALDKKSPFGTVMVAIDKQGLPHDVQVVPVSRLARESNTDEIHIVKSLESSGCLLMDPDTFGKLLDNIEHKILDGSMSLPACVDELARELESMSPGFIPVV